MYIRRVELTNIRCFERLVIDVNDIEDRPPWTMLVGDNATGKTTLLRCLAMGLCDEASAAGLLKESDEGIIRRGFNMGVISLHLMDPKRKEERFRIKTTIKRFEDGPVSFELVRQTTTPKNHFPWKEIFVSAYGAGRGTSGAGDIAGYTPINATYNLFNYSEGLQNPELTLLRIKHKKIRNQIRALLADVLGIKKTAIGLKPRGITISGDWGDDMPLRDLADGIKSSFLWITDFLGWAIDRTPHMGNLSDICGILLIDEIEQHLHPRWRQKIVQRLRKCFPSVQFISTTHSEIVARTVGGPKSEDLLYLLELNHEHKRVDGRSIETIEGLDLDQAIKSEAFSVKSSTSQIVRYWMDRFQKLKSKKRPTAEEIAELETLKLYFDKGDFYPGEDAIERVVKKVKLRVLSGIVEQLDRK